MKTEPYILRWKNEPSEGFFDVLPAEKFLLEGVAEELEHLVLSPKGERSQARCRLTVQENSADLDYEAFSGVNKDRGMELGVLRLFFSDKKRSDIKKVEWKGKGEGEFKSAAVDLVHRELYGELKRLAKEGQSESYTDVGRRIGISINGLGDVGRLSGHLDVISRFEDANQRPLLSAVVVSRNTERIPGKGFFKLASRLRGQKIQNKTVFHREELGRVFDVWKEGSSGGKAKDAVNYWVEQYWPNPGRDLTRLYVWVHEGNRQKGDAIRVGDPVLFYEVGKHPEKKWGGAKALFGCGLATGLKEDIPASEYPGGGKAWLYRSPIDIEVAVPPGEGIPLEEVMKVLGYDRWRRKGFYINREQYLTLRKLLIARREECNRRESQRTTPSSLIQDRLKAHESQVAPKITVGVMPTDPSMRAALLEKAHGAHVYLLNKLADKLKGKGLTPEDGKHIDLSCVAGGDTWIFEVKSSHDGNYLSQVRHGVSQLYEYRFRQKDARTKLCLVILTPPPKELAWIEEYLTQDRQIELCWPVPGGFFCTSEPLAELLGAKAGLSIPSKS